MSGVDGAGRRRRVLAAMGLVLGGVAGCGDEESSNSREPVCGLVPVEFVTRYLGTDDLHTPDSDGVNAPNNDRFLSADCTTFRGELESDHSIGVLVRPYTTFVTRDDGLAEIEREIELGAVASEIADVPGYVRLRDGEPGQSDAFAYLAWGGLAISVAVVLPDDDDKRPDVAAMFDVAEGVATSLGLSKDPGAPRPTVPRADA
jgi:hypothetical protein